MAVKQRQMPNKVTESELPTATTLLDPQIASDLNSLMTLPKRPAHVPQRWYRRRAFQRNVAYVATISVPLVLLGILTFVFGMSPIASLLVSALVYAGMYLLLNWRPEVEVERETTQDDIRRSLENSRQHVNRLRDLVPILRPLFRGNDAHLRLKEICRLAGKSILEFKNTEGTTLRTVTRLEFILSETLGILKLFHQVASDTAGSFGSLAPTAGKVEHDVLALVESSLMELSTSLNEEDTVNLEVAIRVLESTLKTEGLSRKS